MESAAVLEFEAVYRRHESLVRATLRRYGVRPADLDDVTQEVFVTIHRRLCEFEGRSSLETWLHAVCWRAAVGYRRRAHIRREAVWTVERSDEAERVIEGLPAERLHAVLGELPEQQRELLALSEAGGLSISALAEVAGCTRETASEHLKQARLALRRRIDRPQADVDAAGDAGAGDAVYDIEGAIETADSFDYIDDEGCLCVLGAKTFAVYRRGPSARFYGFLKEAMRKSMEREGPRLTYIAIVERGSATVPIDRAARKVHQEIIGMLSTSVLGAAITVETGGGFNLVPAVVNAAVFLTRSKIPFRYFNNLASAATWLAPRSEGETSASLVAQIEWMRARLDARDAERGLAVG